MRKDNTEVIEMHTRRVTTGDRVPARTMFAMMPAVFEEEFSCLSDECLNGLQGRDDFWVIA